MFDLLKVSENYNCHLPKIGKLTVTGSFDLPKVRKITKVTHPKLVKVTSTLTLTLTQALDFMNEIYDG